MNQVPINSYAGIYYRRILTYMKKAFKEIGLTFEEGVILQNIMINPDSSQDEIARALVFDTAAVARALKELEGKGYVSRRIDPDNQRKKIVSITAEGTQIALKINEIMENWDNAIFKGLKKNEKKEVVDDMRFLKDRAYDVDINELLDHLKDE